MGFSFLLLLLLCMLLPPAPIYVSAQHTPCRCLPHSLCWPGLASWHTFNSSLGGHLLIPSPPASPCHVPTFNPAACQIARLNWTNPFWRADQVGAMQAPNWEADGNRSCLLNSQPDTVCYRGSVPVYAVEVLRASHVQTAVRFAAQYNLRLSIKSTGHDYLGRSTAPGSLNLWMHRLKQIEFHDAFIPDGCGSKGIEGVSAVTAEAGVQWRELYKAAEAEKLVLVGAMSSSVSAAGGYVQGGGHGPLSPMLGLAADNAVQFKVVTADGRLRTANSCQNQDLFWALRGGGGGTYGVVISATHKTFPALSAGVVGISVLATANDSASLEGLLSTLVGLQPSLSDGGWAGYSVITPSANSTQTSVDLFYLLPNSSNVSLATTAFNPFTAYANLHHPAITAYVAIAAYSSFQDWHVAALCSVYPGVCSDTTGTHHALASRLFSKAALNNFAAEVAHTFTETLSSGMGIVASLVGGGAVAEKKNNAVNPAWRKAVWHVVLVASWGETASEEEKAEKLKGLTRMNGLLRELTPGSGSYVNEADVNEPHWQQSFFGENYQELRRIKQRVDPEGLFMCRECVGSEGWSPDLNCHLP